MTLFLATQTIQPIFPLYITQRGASTFELGIIVSLLSFTAIIAKVPLGILTERIGKWPVIPIALLGQSASLILYSIASSPYWFYPIRVFHALILAAFTPAAMAIASDLAPEGKRGDRIGRFLTSFGVAAMFGPLICSLLLEYFDYAQLLQLAAIIPLLGFAAFLLANYKNFHTLYSVRRRLRKERRFSLIRSLRRIVFSRNVLVLSFLRLTFSFTNAFFITIFAIYALEQLHLTSSLIAVLFGVKGVTNMAFRFPSGKLSDRIGYKVPLVFSYLLLTVVYLVISESRDFYFLSFAMAIYGLAHGMRAVTEWSLHGESTPSKISGLATAYLSTMFNIGGAFGAVASGTLSLVLPTSSIFKLASLITLSGSLISLFIKQNLK